MVDPANTEEVFQRLLTSSSDGWRKIASSMIPPIRKNLKDLYGLEMTKSQEYEVEAAVYEKSLTGVFSYKEAIRLQNKLTSEFKGETKML